MNKKELTQEQRKLILDYYCTQKLSVPKTAELTKISTYMIRKFLKERGLNRSVGTERKYTHNETFFNYIKTEKQAYWLGVLYADGCVSKDNSNSGVLRFSSIDKEWVEQFKIDINATNPILEEIHKKFNKSIWKIKLSSTQTFDDLCKHGCIPNKSLIIKFPKLSSKLVSHFIRGFFDGDGCISEKKYLSGKDYTTLKTGFCSGSKEFLEELIKFLPTKHKKIEQRKNKNLYEIRFSVNDSTNLYHYMYKNSTVWLKRKRDKFEKYFIEKGSTTIIAHPN